MNATYGVAPQDFVAPHPAKHMYLAPSELQSASVEHVFEHALPTVLHPPSLLKTARSRHAPEPHSLSEEHVALAGFPPVLLLLQATMGKTGSRMTKKKFMERPMRMTQGVDERGPWRNP
jgi:hypothetical protein